MPYLQVHVDEDPETVIRRHAIELKVDCGYDDYAVDQLHTVLYFNNNNVRLPIWRVLIRWEWLLGVVVPYHTDGKIRASRVELLEVIS